MYAFIIINLIRIIRLWAKPKQYIQQNAKRKLIQITVNRPFKTLPQSRLYFSPRSYQLLAFKIEIFNIQQIKTLYSFT